MCKCNENKSVCQCPRAIDWTKPIRMIDNNDYMDVRFLGTLERGGANYLIVGRSSPKSNEMTIAYVRADGRADFYPAKYSVENVPPPKKKGIVTVGRLASTGELYSFISEDNNRVVKRFDGGYQLIHEYHFEYEE